MHLLNKHINPDAAEDVEYEDVTDAPEQVTGRYGYKNSSLGIALAVITLLCIAIGYGIWFLVQYSSNTSLVAPSASGNGKIIGAVLLLGIAAYLLLSGKKTEASQHAEAVEPGPQERPVSKAESDAQKMAALDARIRAMNSENTFWLILIVAFLLFVFCCVFWGSLSAFLRIDTAYWAVNWKIRLDDILPSWLHFSRGTIGFGAAGIAILVIFFAKPITAAIAKW